MTGRAARGVAVFRPRARLLRLIGAELISDDVVAVTELVKNAHDADASTVRISFASGDARTAGILIEDDGHGMDLDALLTRWMEPAHGWKARVRDRRTPRGRRYLGEKGVGRFAADKLASRLEIVSRLRGEPTELRAVFDWDEYDHADRMLADVSTAWEVRPAREIARHGTLLRLTGLRTRWTERMYRRLSNRLARLRPPFDEGEDRLSIVIDSDEFPAYSGEVGTGFLDRAPYQIEANYDGVQSIEFTLSGGRAARIPWSGSDHLSCGPVRVRVFAFDLETEAVARVGPRMDVRAWLREWSGMSVYRDGFRVWPYGEPHDDWLRLDQRRVNNPVVRLSNNQVVGFVEITGDGNPELRDQTNREGLIHNRAFEDLRRLVHVLLQLLEAERQSRRHPPGRASEESTVETGPAIRFDGLLDDLISQVERGDVRQARRLARHTTGRLAAEHERMRSRLRDYTELAAAGHAIGNLQASVRPLLEGARGHARELGQVLGEHRTTRVEHLLLNIGRALEIASQRMRGFQVARLDDGQRRRVVDVAVEIRTWAEHVRPLVDRAGIELAIEVPPPAKLRTELGAGTLGRLLDILAMNSIEWLGGMPRQRIRVSANGVDDRCEILFSDSGPGIPEALAHRVFEARFSTREGSPGMGLTIARDLVELQGGTIAVVLDGRRRGATLRIVLPRRRSRATVSS